MKHDRHHQSHRLRHDPAAPEKKLWQQLCGPSRRSLRFRRDHPLGPFTADFWCAAARVVVELDESTGDAEANVDTMRDRRLREWNVVVLRFTRRAVAEQLDDVLAQIERTCQARIGAAPPLGALPEAAPAVESPPTDAGPSSRPSGK